MLGRGAGCVFLLLVWAAARPASAQRAHVRGQVTGGGGTPIALADVELYGASVAFDTAGGTQATSAPPVARTVTDSLGRFALVAPAGSYLLRVRFLSFMPLTRRLRLRPGERSDLGVLTLTPRAIALPGVVARGQRSALQLGFEKRVFRVGKDITVAGGSVLNVLNNVPSVTAGLNGTVQLRGSSAVRILIDGKPSTVYRNGSRALQSLSADMIAEVQVITNPSARYVAEGSAGIINIVLKKHRAPGFHGTVGLMQRAPESTALTTNLNLGAGRVSWFLNGDVAYAADPSHSRSYERYASPDTAYVYQGFDDGRETDYDGNLRLGLEVRPDSAQALTASTLWHFEDKRDLWHGGWVDSTLAGGLLDPIIRSETIGGGEVGGAGSLEYARQLGGDAHKLTASADYDHSTEKELPRTTEAAAGAPFDSVLDRIDDSRIADQLRLRADYTRPLADSGKLEAGARASWSRQDHRYSAAERRPGAGWTPLPDFSSNYRVRDQLSAAYATASSALGAVSWQLGLRAERYAIVVSPRAGGAGTRQSYLDVFPSAFLTYAFSGTRSLQVSYSRRVSRPDAALLLPATDFSSTRTRFTGNPELRPEYADSYEATLLQSWTSGSLLASAYDRRRRGVIERISHLDSRGVLATVPINLARAEARGLELTVQQDVPGVRMSTSANLFRERSHGTFDGVLYHAETNRLTSRLRLDWEGASGLKVQTAVRYLGPARTVQGRRAATAFANIAIARDFFDGRATVSLQSEDLFSTRRELYTITDPYSFSRQRLWEPTGLRLNITWRIHEKKPADDEAG